MRGFEDNIGDIDERNTERMNFRTKPRIKRTIQMAAALAGVDDSVFTMNSAYRSALETIAAHERTPLSPADHSAFFELIDNPPQPTERLRKAVARYKSAVRSA